MPEKLEVVKVGGLAKYWAYSGMNQRGDSQRRGLLAKTFKMGGKYRRLKEDVRKFSREFRDSMHQQSLDRKRKTPPSLGWRSSLDALNIEVDRYRI